MSQDSSSEYLSVKDAAQILAVNHFTIRRLINSGRLEAFKVGECGGFWCLNSGVSPGMARESGGG